MPLLKFYHLTDKYVSTEPSQSSFISIHHTKDRSLPRLKYAIKTIVELKLRYVQVILFEINCMIFYTNLHELVCQFIRWTNWVNSGKFMDNGWISCQVMADMEKFYDDLIIINLYNSNCPCCTALPCLAYHALD